MKTCPYCAEEIQETAVKCKHCGELLNGPLPRTPPRKFTRSKTDRVFSGLCGGLAEYANIDASILRILTVLAIIFTAILPGILIYIIIAMIVPED